MPNYRCDQTLGGTWFFTVVAYKRKPIFCYRNIRASLRHAIIRTRIKYPFLVDAWVLLPDHLHCVWTLPVNDSDFSVRWKIIKQYVSRDCRGDFRIQSSLPATKKRRRESTIWQRRFWEHKISAANDFATHLDYLHYNPVKHGYCRSPSDWRFSSIHRYQARGVYAPDWAMTEINPKIDFGE